MTAKEMFEELGYKLVYRDKFYIDYSLDDEPIGNWGVIIQFMRKEKIYRIYSYGEIRDEIINVNMELNKAIQKQIEELGWL